MARSDDQNPLYEAARLHLLQNEARHDRLPRTGVVGDQEAKLRLLQRVVVDRLDLVRQRIDLRDADREHRVELVG